LLLLLFLWPLFFLQVAFASVSKVVSPGGGTVKLAGIASVTFPDGAFATNTTVRVESTSSVETNEDFEVTAEMFSAGHRLPYEIRINTGRVEPLTDFKVRLAVPGNAVPTGSGIHVFAQIFYDGEHETLDYFEVFSSTYNVEAKTVQVTLPKEAFTNQRRADDTFEAVIILASVPYREDPIQKQGPTSISPLRSPILGRGWNGQMCVLVGAGRMLALNWDGATTRVATTEGSIDEI